MAALPAGGLKSVTLEDTLLEVAQLLNAAEQAAVPPQSRVAVSLSTDSNLVTISASLPIMPTISATGALTIATTEYA